MASNLWSFAGENERTDVNSFLLQYFVNYNFPTGWYLTSTPIVTANWKAESDERWSQVAVALADTAALSQEGVGHNLE